MLLRKHPAPSSVFIKLMHCFVLGLLLLTRLAVGLY